MVLARYFPLKPVSLRRFQLPRFCKQVNFVKHFNSADRFTLRFPHPFPRGSLTG